MAQDIDELGKRLQQLGQLFADLGVIIVVMRERIAAMDRLREPLKNELEVLQVLIGQVVPLL